MFNENKSIKTAIFPIAKKYDGNHPIEEHHHYENLLEEVGLIEMAIVDVKFTNWFLIIKYESC